MMTPEQLNDDSNSIAQQNPTSIHANNTGVTTNNSSSGINPAQPCCSNSLKDSSAGKEVQSDDLSETSSTNGEVTRRKKCVREVTKNTKKKKLASVAENSDVDETTCKRKRTKIMPEGPVTRATETNRRLRTTEKFIDSLEE